MQKCEDCRHNRNEWCSLLDYLTEGVETHLGACPMNAVDKSEERRGSWVRCDILKRGIIGYECSECGEICRGIEYIPECDFHAPTWNYCPNCGCYMKD